MRGNNRRNLLGQLGLLWLIYALFLSACGQAKENRSELFQKIFLQEEGTFRGIDLGEPLKKARTSESQAPFSDDQFGLVYRLNLGGKDKALVEYMSASQENRIVNAINLNVFLSEESDARDFYAESEMFLRSRHGVEDGSFGNFNWEDLDKGMEINLRMLDDKRSFSLVFAPLNKFITN